LVALCYSPGEEIRDYLDEIEQFLPEKLAPVTAWLKTYYLKATKGDNPMFSPDFWSVSFQLNVNLITTQIDVEAWHHRMQVIINTEHIGVFKLIQELQKEVKSTAVDILVDVLIL
jgi:hypothetical protein